MSFNAILFPADERAPHVVSLMTSSASPFPPLGQSGSQQPLPSIARIPHPEVYMDFIAEGVGSRAWQSHVSFKFAPGYYLLVSIRTPAFHFSFTLTFFHFPSSDLLRLPEWVRMAIPSFPHFLAFLSRFA